MEVEPRFHPHINVLPQAQRLLWNELGSTPDDFVLFGGTALALRLGHRQSVDFDFFSPIEFDPRSLYESIPYLKGGTVIQMDKNTLTCLVSRGEPIKISFFGGIDFPRIDPVDRHVVNIGGLRDIAGMKVSVVQVRAESKDYVDLYEIMKTGRVSLSCTLSCAKLLYGDAFNPLISLKALSCFNDGDLSRISDEVKDFILNEVKNVDLDNLPPCREQDTHADQ